jgi:ElaB/YqjD/DUF883 family membrane-anchored ribosome-binding protein
MDNQKTNDGNARDLTREGAGSSMGKDLGTSRAGGDAASTINKGASDLHKGIDRMADAAAPAIDRAASGAHVGIDRMANAAQPAVERFASNAHAGVEKVANVAQPAMESIVSNAHSGVDKVSGALTDASRRVEEKSRELSEAYHHFADTSRDYVRKSPATSVLVALAAGFALARIFGGRRD